MIPGQLAPYNHTPPADQLSCLCRASRYMQLESEIEGKSHLLGKALVPYEQERA